MKNTVEDLNNYLFEAMERLDDDSLTDEELDREIKRSAAINNVAVTIIQNVEVCIKAGRLMSELGKADNINIPMLESGKK